MFEVKSKIDGKYEGITKGQIYTVYKVRTERMCRGGSVDTLFLIWSDKDKWEWLNAAFFEKN